MFVHIHGQQRQIEARHCILSVDVIWCDAGGLSMALVLAQIGFIIFVPWLNRAEREIPGLF